jgi:hypothetical protein
MFYQDKKFSCQELNIWTQVNILNIKFHINFINYTVFVNSQNFLLVFARPFADFVFCSFVIFL